MQRAYYTDSVSNFLLQEDNYILGELVKNNQFSLDDLQRNTWISEIQILKNTLIGFENGTIIFEYTIPRMGKRIDNILLFNGICYLLEFKVGETDYPRYAMDQVMDYALDLKNFHKCSHNLPLVPILICTKADTKNNIMSNFEDNIFHTIMCNASSLRTELTNFSCNYKNEKSNITADAWINSLYMPTPTIIEAAQVLYRDHDVKEISRSDSGAQNLKETTEEINKIIEYSKNENRKSICFITGVPGAGKTLAGLNIANERHRFDENEHAIFLSGNGPLVEVLQEALARDEVAKKNGVTKSQAKKNAKAFIQIIHHFRDDALSVATPPIEKVAIFDEAQRAWDKNQTSKFMRTKKGVPDFYMSEPEFLISIMDRHDDWAVIICLIGGGQEINVGEAGLSEWFTALKEKYRKWDVYLSDRITDTEYIREGSLTDAIQGLEHKFLKDLHLSVSLRSFRSEKVASFVKALLDVDKLNAKEIYCELYETFPLVMTRDLDCAKQWVFSKARGTERFGLTASSGARRLKTEGIWIQSKIDAVNWFLNDKSDVRSSYYFEDTATEFDIQGLELDWTILAWDANLRFENDNFTFYNFSGTKWQTIRSNENIRYLKNAYRVLLTRARQGLIIYIPLGDKNDNTRNPTYYDGVYHYLKEIGVVEII